MNILKETETLIIKDRYNFDTLKIKKQAFPETKSEETLSNYIHENDLKTLKTEFPDKWNISNKKLAYPYECFDRVDDNQKTVDLSRKETASVK